eukprot:66008_1
MATVTIPNHNSGYTETTPLLANKLHKTEDIGCTNKGKYCVLEVGSSDKISYMEHGRSNGIIVFYFGATNFNNQSCPDTTGVLNRLNVRLLIIDRPGYGQTTLRKNYNDTPLLFAQNTFKYILAHFGAHKKHFFIGYQTGCVYLLSIAYWYPANVNEMSLICPPTPYLNGPNHLSKTYSVHKCCHSYCLWSVFCCYYSPKIKDHYASHQTYLEYCKQQAMEKDSDDYKYMKKHRKYLESYWKLTYDKNASYDRIWDECFVLKASNWGFPIQLIKTKVHLWYGTKDVMSPHSSWYLSVLQNVTQHRIEGYGHLLIYPKFDQILASMIHCDL